MGSGPGKVGKAILAALAEEEKTVQQLTDEIFGAEHTNPQRWSVQRAVRSLEERGLVETWKDQVVETKEDRTPVWKDVVVDIVPLDDQTEMRTIRTERSVDVKTVKRVTKQVFVRLAA